MNTTLDKVRGMFIGVFLGDALGAPHEFKCNSNTPYTGVLQHRPFRNTQFQGRKEIEVGQVTDDSELTLALLRTLIKDTSYIKNNVILSYLQWANSGGWMIGNNTKALFKGVKTIKGYQSRLTKLQEISQSNGGLMRCSPLALIYDNTPVIEDINITNPHPICRDCNLVYVNSLRLALQGYDPKTIFHFAKQIAQTDPVKEVLKQVEDGVIRDIVTNKGWCLHGLWCAFVVLTSFTNFADAMKWVITSQPGSDTDTNACISGALLGAFLGFDSINSDPVTSNNINILINVNTQLGPTPRPDCYTVKDFFNLTQQAYNLTL